MYQHQSPGLAEFVQTLLGLNNIDKMSTHLGIKAKNSYYAASQALAFTNYRNLSAK